MSEHDTTRDGCPTEVQCDTCAEARRLRSGRYVWVVCEHGSTVLS